MILLGESKSDEGEYNMTLVMKITVAILCDVASYSYSFYFCVLLVGQNCQKIISIM